MNPQEYDKKLFEAEKEQLIEKRKLLKNSYDINKVLLNDKLELSKENEKLKKKYLKK